MSVFVVFNGDIALKSFLLFEDAKEYFEEVVSHEAITSLLTGRGITNPDILHHSPFSLYMQFLLKALNITKEHVQEVRKTIQCFYIKSYKL